jgi:hypothetical protein
MTNMEKTKEGWQRARLVSASVLRAVALWTIWFALTATWIATLVAMTAEGRYVQWLQAGAVVFLLYILAKAEGLELAVADLLDKSPEQLHDARVRNVLRHLQQDPADFFSNRQLFVVTIIAFTTLMTTYPWIYIPFIGKVSQEPVPGLFSFAWTTLSVLWFAQVAPKRLAIINSEIFLSQSVFLMPVIKAVGYLGIPRGSDHLVVFFEKFTKYRDKRHLQPSSSAYYNATGVKSGISADRVQVTITTNPDGSGTIRRKAIVCFLHGKHFDLSEAIFCKSGLTEEPQLTVKGVYIGLPPERLETIALDLDAISCGSKPDGLFRPVESWPHSITVQRDPDNYYGGEWARWTVTSGRPLPEAYWHPGEGFGPSIQPMIVLVYEVEIHVGPGGLVKDDDRSGRKHVWPEYIDIPTRTLQVCIQPAGQQFDVTLQGCDVRLLRNNTLVASETERCSERAIASHDGHVEMAYPQQGAVYSVLWWQIGDAVPIVPTMETRPLGAATEAKPYLLPPRSVQ